MSENIAEHMLKAPADEIGFDLETLAGTDNYNEWIYSQMKWYLGPKVLELGCGIGNLTEYFLREDREVLAIDIDSRMTREHIKRVESRPRLRVQNVAIQSLVADQQSSYDAVVSSNVLEHIPVGIEADVVRASYQLLKPGGVSTHWVPAMQCIYGTIDKRFEHCRRYSKKSLIALFQEAGFVVEHCRYFNVVGFFGWWWQGRVRKANGISPDAARSFDRWIVPAARRIEPMLWLPFGQSLWISARKPVNSSAHCGESDNA